MTVSYTRQGGSWLFKCSGVRGRAPALSTVRCIQNFLITFSKLVPSQRRP
ncbi:hypothetical protein GGQ68_004708 [Sagittula marina]|uniref:Uncharacterized protein n=1 Tax=Sagittula marina TaxID=943940 RepID=A0A7W6GUA0_9RHOB|nr:hypothetical protein [Sagittula marina]